MATTSSSSLKNNLIYFKKKLERTTDEEEVVHIIHKLAKIPMTIDLLKGTGAGKIIRVLAKKPDRVGHKASSLLKRWREIMVTSEKSDENFKEDKPAKSSIKEPVKEMKHSSERHSKEKHSKDKHYIEKHSKENISKEKEKLTKDRQNKDKYSKEYVKEKHAKSSHKEKDINLKNSMSKLHRKSESSTKHISEKASVTSRTILPAEDFTQWENGDDRSIFDRESYFDDIPDNIPEMCQNLDVMRDTPSKHHSSVSKSDKVKNKSELFLADEFNKKSSKSHSHKTESSNKEKYKKSNGVIKESRTDDLTLKKSKESSSSSIKKVSKKVLKKIVPTEEFTASEVSFEDCLGFNDIVPVKKRKSTNKPPSNPISKKIKVSSKSKTIEKVKNIIEPPKIKIKNEDIIQNLFDDDEEEKMNFKNKVDVSSTLPQTQPNYRPLPQRSYDSIPVKKKVLTDEDAIKFTSSRREKTAVYSGRKNCYLTEVPSLFECCTRILIENIDDIEYMGEIPYFLLESMLQRCTPQQLYRIEHYNPYLLEDTNELWEKHCKRDYRNSAPQENETWRELYWRSHEEQEQRLRNVTANISASIANSNPVRKAKLAYIDSFVKPPRDVARRQAKNGTATATSHSVSVKVPSPIKSSPKAVTSAAVSSASTSKPPRVVDLKPQKPKVAPLMAKTLKSMKQCFRR